MASALSGTGLLLTLIGSALLYKFSIPEWQIGSHYYWGPTHVDLHNAGDSLEGYIPSPEADRLSEERMVRFRLFNRGGFALIAAGTVLQLLAVLSSACWC